MFTRLLRTLQSLVQFSFLRVAMETNDISATYDEMESWLFEDSRKTQSLTSLPVYPAEGALTEGESHRLDMLSAAVGELSAKISNLLERPAIPATTMRAEHVSDIVVTDFLFEGVQQVDPVEADLFDVFPRVSGSSLQNQIIAASQTGRLKGLGSDLSRTELCRGG